MITEKQRIVFINSLKLIYGVLLLLLIPSDILMLLALVTLSAKLLVRHPIGIPQKVSTYPYEFYSTERHK